jgi:hypothetical protein
MVLPSAKKTSSVTNNVTTTKKPPTPKHTQKAIIRITFRTSKYFRLRDVDYVRKNNNKMKMVNDLK